MNKAATPIEQLAINTIRTLSMDAVQAANSGHPGTPMALAPAGYVLFNDAMCYDPADPTWPNRDRFVLSCGHASMLLYALLHLSGVRRLGDDGRPTDAAAITLDDIRNFRQLESPCAGHPENYLASGVETTTGPLGQGVGNSVGMAIAERWLAAHYNRPGFDLFNYNIFALCSDGDVMEGIGCEAASIAGHLKLANLCWVYDDNHITIEGNTRLAFSEDVATRFIGLGWNVVKVDDANDLATLRAGIEAFRRTTDRPTLIIVRSVIGYGSPNKANSHDAHGSPLGEEEIRLTKKAYGWPEDAKFLVPEGVGELFAEGMGRRGAAAHATWTKLFGDYRQKFPELAAELETMWRHELPAGWDAEIPVFPADAKGVATRVSSGKVLNAVAKHIPWMIGGSADLAPSNNTRLTFAEVGDLGADNYGGRIMHFGVREHGMAAVCNGIALSGPRPFGATFFVFTDYMRPSMRLATIMGLPVLYILTHDSIGLGEDGPTHQPVEHLAALRAMPNMWVMRPGDANEVAAAYRAILARHDGPVSLVLTRQNLPTLDRTKYASAEGVLRGAYVLADAPQGKQPEVILLGTGSELSLCVAAYEKLTAEGVAARVVSMPCWELFEAQPQEYRDAVLPPDVTRRVAVETGVKFGWERYIGRCGRFVGMCGYGASAPAGVLMKHFGFTVENVVAAAKGEAGTACVASGHRH